MTFCFLSVGSKWPGRAAAQLGGIGECAGYEIPEVTRATSAYGMPGGGYEMKFPYEIPPEFIKVIQR